MMSSMDERRMRRKTIKRLGSSVQKDQARQAAQHVAERIRQRTAAQVAPVSSSSMAPQAQASTSDPNVDTKQKSNGTGNGSSGGSAQLYQRQHSSSGGPPSLSEHSSERAVSRGWNRGSSELNEAGGFAEAGADWNSEFDITTVTEAVTDDWTRATATTKRLQQQQQGRKNKKGQLVSKGKGSNGIFRLLWKRRSSRSSMSSQQQHAPEKDGDAWMCGVCGQAFSTLEAADKHESRHIQQVVDSLGWAAVGSNSLRNNNSFMNTPSNAHDAFVGKQFPSFGGESESTNSAMQQQQEKQLAQKQQQQQSMLAGETASTPLTGTMRRRAFQNHNRLESFQEDLEEDCDHDQFDFLPEDKFPDFAEEEKVPEDEDTNRKRPARRGSWLSSRKPPPIQTTMPQFASDDLMHVPAGALIPKPRARTSSEPPIQTIMPQFVSDNLPAGALIPRPRARTSSEVRFMDTAGTPIAGGYDPLMGIKDDDDSKQHHQSGSLLLSKSMRDYVVLADEALITVCERAEPFILTKIEMEAERELKLLARDKQYYDEIAERSLARKKNPSNRFRTDGKTVLGKVKNKFVDAYQIIKEGDGHNMNDQYNRKNKNPDDLSKDIVHTDRTLYVNVMVKNSVEVVRHELERLARNRWEKVEEIENFTRFERFRVMAHENIVKLAGIALASDFTPRRIAVQLSNDLYNLLKPRLKRRGVTIETEIEYRVGPYFVLAVNITTIDWRRLIRATHRDVNLRKVRWEENRRNEDFEHEEGEKKGPVMRWMEYFKRLFRLTKYDVVAQFLAWLYHVHWTIYLPICLVSYYVLGLGQTIRSFIISSVTDEIFFYVEEKGMEMEIEVRKAATQAAFMLSALREIRADGRELKKKRQETESEERRSVLGPLLGPAIKADKQPASPPPGFEIPDNLEFVGLELDLPVGFRRLRWAFLNSDSEFLREALYKTEAKYENITSGKWSKHNESIGLPDSVDPEEFTGAEREGSYLMPKSAFVNANMSYETQYIVEYNDYCFCLKKKSLNPDAPFGSTFVAWTQYLVVNTGNDSCRLCCSVEAEFPNGPPLVSRQIKSGMRAGTGELFVLFGETVTKYADEYP